MPIIRKIQSLLKRADLFPSNQFLRYQNSTQFSTAMGGGVSILIIVLMITLFINMGVQTINKQLISSTISYSIQHDPDSTDFTTSVNGEFMFGFYMLGLNLKATSNRLFDVSLTQVFYGPLLAKINQTSIPLVRCTEQHFDFNEATKQSYKRLFPQNSLCPQIGAKFNVRGSGTSSIYSRLQWTVTRCNSSLDLTCASDGYAAAVQSAVGGYFIYGLMSINSIVNPNDENYQDYYLDDSNYYYLFLSSTTSAAITAQLEQNQINTDVSLMPFKDNLSEKSLTISPIMTFRTKPLKNNLYAQINLEKSKRLITYTRSFNKLDNLFSYIGGFVGVVLLVFFTLSSYSGAAFNYSIAQDLFSHSSQQVNKPFNFLYYISIQIKGFLQLFNYSKPWKETDYFVEHMEEAEEQLDIALILKRLFYLQEVISILLKSPQLQTLYLSNKIGRKTAKERRLKCGFLNKFKEQIAINNKNSRQLQFQSHEIGQNIIITQNQLNQLQEQVKDNSSINTQYLHSKMKANMLEVIQQSKKGDQKSRIILQKINPFFFKQYDLKFHDQTIQIHQIQQEKRNQNQIYLEEDQFSKNKNDYFLEV